MLFLAQGLDVSGVFEGLSGLQAARVDGKDLLCVADPDGLVRSKDGQRTPHRRVRDRVVVFVEADIGSLADADLDALLGWEGGLRNGK